MPSEKRSGRLSIERQKSTVILTMECPNTYEAMQFYDEMCQGAKSGYVEIVWITKEPRASEDDDA